MTCLSCRQKSRVLLTHWPYVRPSPSLDLICEILVHSLLPPLNLQVPCLSWDCPLYVLSHHLSHPSTLWQAFAGQERGEKQLKMSCSGLRHSMMGEELLAALQAAQGSS